MNTDKEQWIDEHMGSVERIERVKAREDLYDEIEHHLFSRLEEGFSSLQWKWVAATVGLLLMVNVVAVQLYVKNNQEVSPSDPISYTESLMSDYKLYE